jgi:hypothetical protein
MSRDRRDRSGTDLGTGAEPTAGADDRHGPIDPERSAALVTAYVDGISELAPDDRHGIEALLARDPAARAEADAVHALLGRLRALPPNYGVGDDPDWAAMERSIRRAVASAPPRPWWRRWQWLVPAMTCATAAAVLLVIWPRSATPTMPATPTRPVHIPGATHPGPTPEAPDGDGVVALWLDGGEVDVDLSAPDELADVGLDLGQGLSDPSGPSGTTGASALHPAPSDGADADADEIGLLPPVDLAWVDSLDDDALDRAERWLANPGRAAPGHPDHPRRLDELDGARGPSAGPSMGKKKI